MGTFSIKAGDTLPAFSGKCTDANGSPVPTLGSTVRFRMRPRLAGLRDVIDQPAVWDDPATATAKYEWQAGDTDVPGLYDCDFVVTWGSEVESFPNGEYQVVEILPPA